MVTVGSVTVGHDGQYVPGSDGSAGRGKAVFMCINLRQISLDLRSFSVGHLGAVYRAVNTTNTQEIHMGSLFANL